MAPQDTVELLKSLAAVGFTDRAFQRLHHYRLTGKHASISAHSAYCRRIAFYKSDSSNERVHRRLGLVFAAYQSGGFTSGRPQVFDALAEAAFCDIPP